MRLLLGVLLISGCATSRELAWWRADATPQAQRAALYECEKDTRYISVSGSARGFSTQHSLDGDMFTRCMEAHGWRLHWADEVQAAVDRGPAPFQPPPVTHAGPE